MTPQPDFEIVLDPTESRYEAHVRTADGPVVAGMLRYAVRDGVVVVPSTVVLPQYRHRGLASALVRRTVEDARRDGRQVEPRCWYVSEWIDRHPEFEDVHWQGPESDSTMGA